MLCSLAIFRFRFRVEEALLVVNEHLQKFLIKDCYRGMQMNLF